MWRVLSRSRNIASRSLQLSRRFNSQWRAPPPPSGTEQPVFIGSFLWKHKTTVLLSVALFFVYQDYITEKNLNEKPNTEFIFIWSLFATKAADKHYDQVDFDDPAQNISYYKRLQGHLHAHNALDALLARLEGDPRKEDVYTICRQAAKDIHLAISSFEGKETVELAVRVLTIYDESVVKLNKVENGDAADATK